MIENKTMDNAPVFSSVGLQRERDLILSERLKNIEARLSALEEVKRGRPKKENADE